MAVLCIIPNSMLRWALVILCFGYSTFFLVKNLQVHLSLPLQEPDGKTVTVAAAAAACHFLFGLVFKLYFFQAYTHPQPDPA